MVITPQIWVVVANTVLANIYSVRNKNRIKYMKSIAQLQHAESRKKTQELVTDKPGQYHARGTGYGAYELPHNPHELEHEKFAKEIADFLEKNRKLEKFQGLILVAEPHFYGLLNKHFHPPLQQLVQEVVEKDIAQYEEQDIKNYLHGIFTEKI